MQSLSLTDQDGNLLAVLHGAAVSAPISGARRELPQEHRPDGTVEETFRLLLQGAGIRACLTALEEILASSRSGFRPAYLTLQDTADSPAVRTPVLDGCLDGLGAGLEDRRRGAQALRLRLTRPDWWEEALVGLPLSNLHGTDQTAGLQLDNLDDLTRDNFADIAAADLDGSLPAPAQLEFQYATGQTDRLYYTIFAHGTGLSDSGGSLNNVLEGEDAVQGAGITNWSKIANAQVSAGYYQVMSWSAVSEVQLATWTLPAARLAYMRGKFFRPVLRHRLLPNLEGISVRWKIPNAAGSGYALQSGQTRLSTARYISATAALPLPPVNLPAGPYEPVTLELWGECSTGATKTLAIDCIHLLPTEGWLELEPLGGVGALETLVAESDGGYVYRLDAAGLRGISHTPIGNFISLQPAFPLAVERMSWCALGGAETAVLVGGAGGWACEDWILDWLRRPVIIHSADGQPLWWGYTARIEARQGRLSAVYNLERMANRAAVCYNRRVPELDWVGTPQRTAWAEEARSAGLYGQKERLLRLDSIEEAGALLARDSALARDAFPNAVPGAGGADAGAQVQLRITCRGWWHTIGWRYFENLQGVEGYAQAGSLAAPLGNSSANTALAQSFQSAYGSAWLLGGVDCLVRLSSAALADNLVLTVRADNAGLPGAALATSSISAGLLRGGRWWARFQLTTPLAIADATPYWACLSRSGALNAADYYLWSREDANPYSAGSGARFDGTVWTTQPSSDYSCVTSGLVPRSERIQALLSSGSGGQFLTGVVLRSQPNGYSPLYAAGLRTCLEELRHEFDLGDSSAPTLLAQVRVDRSLEISAEPSPGSEELVIKPDGGIYDLSGQRLEEGGSVAGRRGRFAAGWLGESSLIQRAEWTPSGGLRVVLGE